MELLNFLTSSAELSSGSGPEDHVVLSSRVRLARNVNGIPFPGRAKKKMRLFFGQKQVPGEVGAASRLILPSSGEGT